MLAQEKYMTKDKQIIIDGCDVSGCEFAVKPINYNEIKCHCCKGLLQIATMHEQPESIRSGVCENNPNCYYKQLKRKEQECETLASQLDFEVQKKECLEQECEELKDKLNCCFCNPHVELNDTEKLRKCKEIKECFRRQLDQLKAENDELTSKCSQLEEELQKYKDREQWEIELNKKRADSFKEMRRMLYGKLEGNSLIEKRSPYGN